MQGFTRAYKRLQEVTKDYKGFKKVTVGTSCYKRIERVTGGYNGFLWLQGLRRSWGVTTGYKGLHEETLDYKRLQGVTRGYRGLEGVTKG